MNPDRWQQINEAFLKALEQQPDWRPEFLKDAYPDDTELWSEVLGLLQIDDEAARRRFLEDPCPLNLKAQLSEPSSTAPGTAGTRFRVLRFHAEGGLGTVSVALDSELNREVAFKEIKPSRADDPSSRGRFVLEAEVTGGLEHPGIVPVYGFGRHDDGRPFYAMRFIRGKSLKDAITEFHSAGGAMSATERNLAFRELLDRFTSVCQAIEYAHSRGVLHRDIKPENILLGDYGETLMVDWGLAKPTGSAQTDAEVSLAPLTPSSQSGSAVTAAGAAMGTPAHMPPEQAEGRLELLSARSDVYALGTTLATLLCGRRPVEGGGPQEVLANVRQGHVLTRGPAPAGVPRALWAVCDKAMAREPSERYGSARELAQEVQRYLADEPVSVWPDPVLVRTRRWMRKHPGLSAATTVTGLLLLLFALVGFAAVSSFNQKLEAVNADLRQANQREVEARDRAEENFEAAREAVEEYLVMVTENQKLKEADFTELRKELLKSAQPFYERLRDQKSGDEKVEASRANAFFRLALIQNEAGEVKQARGNYEECITAYQRLARDFPTRTEYRHHLALNHGNLGVLLKNLGDRAGAQDQYRQTLAILKQLTRDFPSVAEYRHHLAGCHTNLGNLLENLGARESARQHYEEALTVQRQLADDFPSVPDYRQALAISHHNLGYLLKNIDERVGAKQQGEKALAIRQRLVEDFPKVAEYHSELAKSHNLLGAVLAGLGQREKARPHHEKALAIQQQLAEDFPTVPEYRNLLAISHHNVGRELAALGERERARQHYQKDLEIRQQLAGDFPTVPEYRNLLADSHDYLGGLLARLGEREEARHQFEKALTVRQQLTEDFPTVPDYLSGLAKSHHYLGWLLDNLGEREKARQHYEKALAIRQRLVEQSPSVSAYRSDLVASHNNLGNVLGNLGERGEARQHYEKALAIQQRLAEDFPSVPEYRSHLAASHNNLGTLLGGLGEGEAARQQLEKALAIGRGLTRDFPAVPEYHRELAKSHTHLGSLLVRLGEQPQSAREHYEKGLAITEHLVEEFPTVSDYRVSLGGNYCNLGYLLGAEEPAASLTYYARAEEVLQSVLDQQPRDATARLFLRNVLWRRAEALESLGRYAEAAESWRQAAQWDDGGRDTFEQKAARSLEMVEKVKKWDRILAGKAQPIDADERIALARYCSTPGQKRYRSAAEQYRQAFIEKAELAREHRYNAACCAALALAGKGRDADDRSPEQQAEWRRQALAWLQADLEVHAKNAASEDARLSSPAKKALSRWLRDPQLAGLRDPAALEQLPEAQRLEWHSFWETVRNASTGKR